MKAYEDDLAYIHHAGFTDFARDATPGVLSMLRDGGVADGLVVDLGCGSGVWAGALTDAGYEAIGIDMSPAMIRLARKTAPAARFRAGSLLDADLPACDAVTSLGECCNYLFDGANDRRGLSRLFRRVHDALRGGGMLVFDVAEPGRGAGPSRSFFEGDDWAILIEVAEDARRRRLTRRITSFRKVGPHYRRSEEVHHLRLYRGADLAEDLRRDGFRARVVRGYGKLRFRKGHVGLVARKLRR